MKVSLTSLLDLTFNILAFSVMTYKPPLATKDFQINLPLSQKKPQQEAVADPTMASAEDPLDADESLFSSVTLNLDANADGTLAGIRIEQRQVQGGLSRLVFELGTLKATMGAGADSQLEAVTIVSPPKLKYKFLVAVVDACSKAGLTKINFAEAQG
jgi:biopolymer transport protein ExbD